MPAKLDLANTENEFFKIINPAPSKNKKTHWNCICKRCGKRCVIPTDSLRSKNPAKSCGCLRKALLTDRNKNNYVDLTGCRFGYLTCVAYVGSLREHASWKCKCDCGNYIITDSGSLKAGYRTSCGCARMSGPVKEIEQVLIDNNINYKTEMSFPDLVSQNNHKLYFDFVIYNLDDTIQKIIEYDGEQHFSSKGDNNFFSDNLETRQKNDAIKNAWCKKNNIELLRISYLQKSHINYNLLFGEERKYEYE